MIILPEKEFEDEFITSTYSAENSVKSGKQSWKNPLKSTQQIREFGTDKSMKLELSEGGSDEPVPTQGLTHNTDPYRFNLFIVFMAIKLIIQNNMLKFSTL